MLSFASNGLIILPEIINSHMNYKTCKCSQSYQIIDKTMCCKTYKTYIKIVTTLLTKVCSLSISFGVYF